MEYKNIKTEQNGKFLTLTINRPDKLNALNIATLSELEMAVKEFYNDDKSWGMIITGQGNKSFVAGADITEFIDFNPEQGKKLADNGQRIFNLIENCPKPVIAAVNGFALGGGCELAMACHIRIASENAKFGQPEVKLGIIPGYGGTQRLVQLIGKSKAMELLMTADMIDASTALNLGLINHITTLESLVPKCIEILNKVATKGPLAITKIINCVNSYYSESGFKKEVEEFGKCFETEDYKEGTSAFVAKREPAFKRR